MDGKSVCSTWICYTWTHRWCTVSSKERKGSATKSAIPCPAVVKLHNNGMGGVYYIDQQTASYQLDCKWSIRFYLRVFFDLLDIACVTMNHWKQLTLLDYKIVIIWLDGIKVVKVVYCYQEQVKEKLLQLQAMTTLAIYQSFSQKEKDPPIVQKKGKKLLLYD